MLVLDEECDDGNTEAGDGCSSGRVEEHYYCVELPSLCFVDLNLTFAHVSMWKSGCNSLGMEFEVAPILPEFAALHITDAINIVHPNISSISMQYNHSNGSITA